MAADLFSNGNSSDGPSALERLSALVDGEVDANAASSACARWRDDEAVRVSWHRYQLIGDVLRSDDLVSTPGHDEAFLVAFRARLVNEPVVLAPAPLVAPVPVRPAFGRWAAGASGRRWSWAAPGAVAAGFVAVAGVLMVTRGSVTPGPMLADESARVASAQRADVSAALPMNTWMDQPLGQPLNMEMSALSTTTLTEPLSQSATLIEPPPLVVNGKFIRDAGLDRYLAAHQQFAGTSALGVPSAFLRSATADMSNR